MLRNLGVTLFLVVMIVSVPVSAQSEMKISTERAGELAELALKCIHREYPNKTGHVMNDSSEVWTPAEMHPAFYGCFDWHSAVHGHWMLVRLLKTTPGMVNEAEVREALGVNLTKANILKELAYFKQEGRKSFERTYGWAWLLKLSEELESWQDPDGQKWASNLQPLTQKIIQQYCDFLPKQEFPIRTGVHPNTAFGLAFALDYTIQEHWKTDPDILAFRRLLNERALDYYANDKAAPILFEPSGEDFFSATLMEADLMSRVLDQENFANWIDQFFSDHTMLKSSNLLNPVVVTDKTDGKLVHLDGLNLSRAWCFKRISAKLPEMHPLKATFAQAAERHADHALNNIISGNYEGEHWLASFAVYMVSD